MSNEIFEKGLKIRREVQGAKRIDERMRQADDFNRPFQEFLTEYCWGAVWGRTGLDRKTRSMLNLALLAALNRPNEFKSHVRGALNNGVTRDEIREILIHVSVYAGVPAAVDAFRNATETLKEVSAEDNSSA